MGTNKWNYLLVLAAAATSVMPGFASPITVSNFSFETVTGAPIGCGVGCSYTLDPVPGWVKTGTSGQFIPGTTPNSYYNTLSDGPTQAFADSGMLSQVVLPTVQLGMIYTLMVDLGNRLDLGFAGSADLLINGNTYTAVGVTPVKGAFGTFTATYIGQAADVGQAITIELKTSGRQGDFDNVRLDASPVPEPATFLLLTPALLMLRRRRQRG